MFSKLINCEIDYIKNFTNNQETKETIKFYDNKLRDMYTHNFILIKEDVCEDKFKEIVSKELENRQSQKEDFLRIEFNFPIENDLIQKLPLVPQVSKYDFMYISSEVSNCLYGNKDCVVKKAETEEILKDGIKVDVLANQSNMGYEFANKRIYRKADVYNQRNSNLGLYVCYHDKVPIGNCELMLNNDLAKIEDFDILENFQRKGFGTSVLKYLIEEAREYGVKFLYLITDSEDTAKEMYKKCGFKKIGEKTELFFKLR